MPSEIDFDKIREFRLAAKLTQEQAAKKAGLTSRQAWNNVEAGRRLNITIDTLSRIAKAVGKKTKDLLK